MKIFPVQNLQGIVIEAAIIVVACLFILLMLGRGVDWLVGIAACSLFSFAGWHYLRRQIYEIRLSTDYGVVEFVRLWSTFEVEAHEIRAIEGRRHRDEDGDVFWEIRVKRDRARRTIDLRHFPRADEFIADIRAMNPHVEITGQWPTVASPYSTPNLS